MSSGQNAQRRIAGADSRHKRPFSSPSLATDLERARIEHDVVGVDPMPLALVSTLLTAFNDNAAITYLSTLVPNFTDALKYAVVAGAVTGGGLTVIANAPNPAGQAILDEHFENGIAPGSLLKAAAVPTTIIFLAFAALAWV